MGDKPDNEPNPHNCANMFWTDGLQPETIIMTFAGWGIKDPADPPAKPPPSGSYSLAWQKCGEWMANPSPTTYVWFWAIGTEGRALYSELHAPGSWSGQQGLAASMNMSMTDSEPFGRYTAGSTIVQTFPNGTSKASWDAAPLFGVPDNLDYFGEELPAVTEPRQTRYASHKTKSVLHLKGDY